MKTCCKTILLLVPIFLLAINIYAATPRIDINRTRLKAKQSLLYCKKKGYDINYCILIDMSLPSGLKRFVVWDFRKHDTLISGLVSHGCGKWPWSGMWSKDKPEFSNLADSHCTALGKYQVNGRAYSPWGMHVKYYLTGLESTNNNALKRQIVFHSWEQIAENGVYPEGTPEGWGCPAISNNTMKIVDALIRREKKHLLLWIYD